MSSDGSCVVQGSGVSLLSVYCSDDVVLFPLDKNESAYVKTRKMLLLK